MGGWERPYMILVTLAIVLAVISLYPQHFLYYLVSAEGLVLTFFFALWHLLVGG